MIVINMFGGPGSGKSCSAAGLYHKMKLSGLNVELVMEYPKDLVYDGTLEIMLDRQEYIFAEQNQRIHRLRKDVDYVITDSPILLSVVYSKLSHESGAVSPWSAQTKFIEFVESVYHTYNNLNIFIGRPKLFQQEGRLHDENESKSLDRRIVDELNGRSIPFTFIPANESTIDCIFEMVKDHEA